MSVISDVADISHVASFEEQTRNHEINETNDPSDSADTVIIDQNLDLNVSDEGVNNAPDTILNNIRLKWAKNVIIGHLNINSLANKFDALKCIIKDKLDILIIGETKLDHTYPERQFHIDGYNKPYRLDRNCNGGGVMIYARKDIPSKMLENTHFQKT